MGCYEQTHICNTKDNERRCLIRFSEHQILRATSSLGFNDKQRGILLTLNNALTQSALQQTVFALGGEGLLASSTVQESLPSTGLPDDQWKKEVQNWFATGLTALQLLIIQNVAGYGKAEFNKHVTPLTERDMWMCSNQIVQRSDYSSFSVVGLAVILTLGSLLILLNVGLNRILPLLQRKSERGHSEWRQFDLLELQCAPNAVDTSGRLLAVHTGDLDPNTPDTATPSTPFETEKHIAKNSGM